MNVELAKRVYQKITNRPELFNMKCWITPDWNAYDPMDYKNPDCGTTACIAGWAVILSGVYTVEDTDFNPPQEIGQKELELTNKQAVSLFFDDDEKTAIRRLKHAIELAERDQLEDDYILLPGEESENAPWDMHDE